MKRVYSKRIMEELQKRGFKPYVSTVNWKTGRLMYEFKMVDGFLTALWEIETELNSQGYFDKYNQMKKDEAKAKGQ